MNFERHIDPKEALGIGIDAMIKEIGGVILRKKDFTRQGQKDIQSINDIVPGPLTPDIFAESTRIYYKSSVVIIIIGDKYKMVKNRYCLPGYKEKGKVKDLPDVIKLLKLEFQKSGLFSFPTLTRGTAKLVASKLIRVVPLKAPPGFDPYLRIPHIRKTK